MPIKEILKTFLLGGLGILGLYLVMHFFLYITALYPQIP